MIWSGWGVQVGRGGGEKVWVGGDERRAYVASNSSRTRDGAVILVGGHIHVQGESKAVAE